MTHDEIVTFEVAKLAKEKGFDVSTDFCYEHNGCLVRCGSIAAPTQSLLQRWQREEKGIIIEVYIDWEDSIEYNMVRYSWRVATIYRVGNHDIGGYYKNESEVYFDSYELALEDALKYALENLV